MRKNLKTLIYIEPTIWTILALSGTQIKNVNEKCKKYVSLFYISVINISAVYITSVSVISLENLPKNKLFISYLIIDLLSILIWYAMKFSKKKLARLVLKLAMYGNRYHVPHISKHKIVNCGFLLMFLILFATPPLESYFDVYISANITVSYTFKYELKDKNIQMATVIIGSTIYCLSHICIPCTTTLTICMLIIRCDEVLEMYCHKLKMLVNFRSNKVVEILREYFDIINLVKLLKAVISIPSFVILTYNFIYLYSILAALLLPGSQVLPPSVILHAFNISLASSYMIIALNLCASQVPGHMEDIRNEVSNLAMVHKSQQPFDRNVPFLIDRIEKKDIIYISACGMIDFRKSFFISAIGSFFAYGLLIINMG